MREIDVREIRAFFDRYRDAFDRLDGDAVARCFAIPSGILTGGAYVHWPAFDAIRANMVARRSDRKRASSTSPGPSSATAASPGASIPPTT